MSWGYASLRSFLLLIQKYIHMSNQQVPPTSTQVGRLPGTVSVYKHMYKGFFGELVARSILSVVGMPVRGKTLW